MRVVVVMNEDGIAVGVVSARMPKVDRAAAHQDREDRGEASLGQSTTRGAQSHSVRNVAVISPSCQRSQPSFVRISVLRNTS
jgi:hypothetical protein